MCAKSIIFNGKQVELDPTICTLRDAFEHTGTPFRDGHTVGIIKGREAQKLDVIKEYAIFTNKGEIRIEINEPCRRLWQRTYDFFRGANIHWAQPQLVSAGPAATDLKVVRVEREYDRWDVTFSLGGFDHANTYLSFIKKRHRASYGTNIVFGKAVAGRNVLEKLENGDEIQRIEPIERLEFVTDKFTTSDLDLKLEHGMEVYTYFKATLSRDVSEGVEHFLALAKDGSYQVDGVTNTFIVSTRLRGRASPPEMLDARSEGAITVRTSGNDRGNVFIYKRDTPSNPNHSVIGYVSEGLELVKIASPQQNLHVVTDPTRIMLLGQNYASAEKEINRLGISLEREGYEGNEAVIVRQSPLNTIDILKAKRVTTYAVPYDKLIKIELYEQNAPKTVAYFRTVAGLRDNPVGSLQAHVKYGTTIMFRAQTAETFDIVPENTPSAQVGAAEIGVSNRSTKYAGLIGVRLEDNKKYGPTGERFNSTNIIGRIVNTEPLQNVRENETIFISETL
ncbi:MAG: methyl-coenzyme M reductase-associated protein Mmp3 [Halobacteriota archaeon]